MGELYGVRALVNDEAAHSEQGATEGSKTSSATEEASGETGDDDDVCWREGAMGFGRWGMAT